MYEAKDEEATKQFAFLLGQAAKAGDVVVLTGDLGAGKTTFSKGIAEGLGITQMIKSPTYTIIREYTQGRLPFYHMDVYRVEYGAEDLGLDDYFEGDGLCVIEWGNLLEASLPEDYLELILEKDDTDEQKRLVKSHAYGTKATAFLQRITTKWQAANE